MREQLNLQIPSPHRLVLVIHSDLLSQQIISRGEMNVSQCWPPIQRPVLEVQIQQIIN